MSELLERKEPLCANSNCSNRSHPVYGSLCEDCWVNTQSHVSKNKADGVREVNTRTHRRGFEIGL